MARVKGFASVKDPLTLILNSVVESRASDPASALTRAGGTALVGCYD